MKIWYDKNKLNLNEFKSEKFLFLPLFDKKVIDKSNDFRNNSWTEGIRHNVQYTTIDDADYIVYHDKLDQGIAEYLQYTNKPILAFFNDDSCKPISDKIPKNVHVFRTSINKTRQKKNEFAMPAWSADFKFTGTTYKCNKPVVSFCGAITDPVREKCIQQLEKNSKVKVDFIIRRAFWGGSPHNPTLRSEYIENIKNSDMVLCCRGAGNFSYRLYETLSVGRIPIIIDTDISLPCDDVIKWSNFIITTPETINEDIEKWWDNIDEKKYKSLQKYSRDIYEKFLCPSGFFNYITNNWKAR
tara:strand:+ start:5694 stop:6590 length:897 start_codon:yes stop_codon:yes gene_type:complete